MPELPEVESVRATLEPCIVGKRITAAEIRRPDYITSFTAAGKKTTTTPRALLQDARITAVLRKGKQLALLADDGRTACLHLGMSGVITAQSSPQQPSSKRPCPLPAPTDTSTPAKRDHIHAVWTLDNHTQILFSDPRRFGGIWTFPTLAALHTHRWNFLGPDAFDLTPAHLAAACAATARVIKAVLLDQQVAAGIGNIYADEALFATGIDPRTKARALTLPYCTALVEALHRILRAAVRAGGSTLRDYRDVSGTRGSAQLAHAVYGRTGLPCPRCGSTLQSYVLGQRTTVSCPTCQSKLRPPAQESHRTNKKHAR